MGRWESRKSEVSFLRITAGMLVFAANEVYAKSAKVPDSVEDLTAPIQKTLESVWTDFIAQLPFIVAGVLVLVVTWVGAAILSRIGKRMLRQSTLRRSLQDLFVRFISIGTWFLGLLLAAMVVFPGVTPSKALGALGVASIAIGFAFKDIFENFFAGILLLWRFPFETGDYIECEGIEGQVEDISVRMTMIRPPTDVLVVVPNAFLFKNPVRVLTEKKKRRVTVITGVAYGENVDEAVEVIQTAVEKCETVDKGHPVQIFPKAFGSSSIDIEVTWWTDPTPVDIRRSRGEVVSAVKRALDEAGIEIPFPYRTLTFKEPLNAKITNDAKENTNHGGKSAN